MKDKVTGPSRAVRWSARGIAAPLLWVPLVCAALAAAVAGLGNLESDSSNEAFMPESDPVTLANLDFQGQFGNQEFYFLLVRGEDVFRPDFLADLEGLCLDLEENLPFLRDITTITNLEVMRDREGMLESWVPYRALKAGELSQVEFRRELEDSLLVKNRLLDGSGTAAGILVTLEKVPGLFHAQVPRGYSPLDPRLLSRGTAVLKSHVRLEEPDAAAAEHRIWETFRDHRKVTSATLEALVEDHRNRGMDIQVTGLPYIDYRIDRFIEQESTLFGLAGMAAAALLMIFLYKSWRGVAGALGVFVLSLALVLGFMGAAGMKISIMTIVLAPLLLVISVSYTIHFMNQYRRALDTGLGDKEALLACLEHTLWPSFLAMATTAFGFLSFLLVPMEPIRELGAACTAGTVSAFLLALVLGPTVWRGWKPSRGNISGAGARQGEFWDRWVRSLGRYRTPILAGFILVTLGSLWGISQIRTSGQMLDMMGPGADFVREARTVSSRLGGAYSADFHIILPEAGLAADPEILEALKEAGKQARTFPGVTLDMSLADLVMELHRILEGETGRLPAGRDQAAQYLLLYEMAGGDLLGDWTDLDYRHLRLSLLFGPDTENLSQAAALVREILVRRLPEGTEIRLAGDLPVMLRMMEMIMEGQLWSLAASVTAVLSLLLVILRSRRLGLMAALSNLFPLAVALGLLGLSGFPLDFVTALVAPMLLGLAVDDTIHFFTALKAHTGQDCPGAGAREGALVLDQIGWSMTSTSLVLAVGFGLFSFSGMASLSHLGILAAGGIAAALAGDLILVPLLLQLIREEKPGNILPLNYGRNNHE